MASVNTTQPASYLGRLFALRDQRTQDWVSVQDPKYITFILLAYLYIAKIGGPQFMKNRKPFGLQRLIQCYNVFQVIANVYFCSKIAYLAYFKLGYSPICQGLTYATDSVSIDLLHSLYYYLLVRVIDLADTVFFVLRKKFSQVSQLHVIHHTIVVGCGWLFMQFGADGHTVFGVCLNSTIHIIMYSYYFLASLGPQVQKYLWWKRYLTSMQIIQFVAILIHGIVPVFINCGYPPILLSLALPAVFLILLLFVNFYIQAYVLAHRKGRHGMLNVASTSACTPSPAATEVTSTDMAKKAD